MSFSSILALGTALLLTIVLPLAYAFKGERSLKKTRSSLALNIGGFFAIVAIVALTPIGTLIVGAADAGAATAAASVSLGAGLGYLAAALSTSCAAIGAGIAVAAAAPAAIGAVSEDSSSFGKALIFVALGEGIALYGMLISILIINKL